MEGIVCPQCGSENVSLSSGSSMKERRAICNECRHKGSMVDWKDIAKLRTPAGKSGNSVAEEASVPDASEEPTEPAE